MSDAAITAVVLALAWGLGAWDAIRWLVRVSENSQKF